MASTTALATAAAGLHGPVDVGLTMYGRAVCAEDPETNPLVLSMETVEWVALKIFLLSAIALALKLDREGSRITRLSLWALIALGVLLILPNAAAVAECRRAE